MKKKIKKNYLCFQNIIFICMFILFIILLISLLQLIAVKKMTLELIYFAKQNEQKLNQLEQVLDNEFNNIRLNTLSIIQGIEDNQNVVNKQFNKTIKIEQTYSNILKEEKLQRVDNTEFDIAIGEQKKVAYKEFLRGNFKNALHLYYQILEKLPNDVDSRLYKALSLFYLNKMDSANYSELLNDCKLLRKNGILDNRIDEMENFIKMEMM